MAGIQSNQKENIDGGQSSRIFQQLQINLTGPWRIDKTSRNIPEQPFPSSAAAINCSTLAGICAIIPFRLSFHRKRANWCIAKVFGAEWPSALIISDWIGLTELQRMRE